MLGRVDRMPSVAGLLDGCQWETDSHWREHPTSHTFFRVAVSNEHVSCFLLVGFSGCNPTKGPSTAHQTPWFHTDPF